MATSLDTLNSVLAAPGSTELNSDLHAVVEKVRASMVRIGGRRGGVGAGAIWHANGLIITNQHVARHAGLTVTLADGRTLPAELLAQDQANDVAALRIPATGLPTIELGDSRRIRPGQIVISLGFPWGVPGGATAGIVIGMGARWPELDGSQREWIMAALHLRPGHSGGPMVDSEGRLLGINTIMTGLGAGGAVPVHVVTAFLRHSANPQQVAA